MDDYTALLYSIVKVTEGYLCLMGVETIDDPDTYSICGLGFSVDLLYCVNAAMNSAAKFINVPVDRILPCRAPAGIKWIPCDEEFELMDKEYFLY